MSVPVPGPPASVLAAISRQDPNHPYTATSPRQRRYAWISPYGLPWLPSLVADEVFMPQFALLDANVLATGYLATQGLTGATAASRYVGATASGPPVTGAFLAGDFIIDQSGAMWICTAAGSPGSWASPAGLSNPMNTPGDLIVGGTSGAPTRLAKGTNGQVLGVTAGTVGWVTNPAGFTNPMTTAGDLITGGTGGAGARLPIGAAGQLLTVVSGAPAWTSQPSTVVAPSGDTSGATDQAAITAALNALTTGGTLVLAPGAFYVTGITVPAQTTSGYLGGLGCSVQGSGWATVVYVVGGGTGFSYHRTSNYSGQYGQPADKGTGFLRDFVVDGTFATAGAVGVDVGDGWGYDINLMIVNFAAAGCIGLWQHSNLFWSEKGRYRAQLINNDTQCVIDSTASNGDISHEYNEYELYIFCNGTNSGVSRIQNGVVCQNGVNLGGCSLQLRGNMGATTASTAGAYSFTANNANPCVFTAAGTALTSGTPVYLTGGGLPAGFTTNQLYYVVSPNGTQFSLAATNGGAGVASTSTGAGTATTAFAALTVTGSNPVTTTAFSQIYFSHIEMKVESNGTGTGAHSTGIVLGSPGNVIQQCAGIITHSLSNSVLNGGEFSFRGMIAGDSNLNVPVTPAMPASGHAVKNLGCDANVCIPAGSTMTRIDVGSVTTGLTSGVFLVPAGGVITPFYSGATPSWVWASAAQSQY